MYQGQGLKICISDTILGDIVASGTGTTVWEPLSQLIEGQDIEANPWAVQYFLQGDSSIRYKIYAKDGNQSFLLKGENYIGERAKIMSSGIRQTWGISQSTA